ncbi:MAG: cbb3-type cytochrome oxidase assembly protein CcoS [Bacteroidetes bacterium]|nr:MAG: cbb3-type cytochrome oxidase assembly protein CcoS [Bacteroidota bacterium]
MNVVPLLVLCSLVLAGLGVVVFLYGVRNHDFEHADRLSLLPLEDDDPPQAKVARDHGAAHEKTGHESGLTPDPGRRPDPDPPPPSR